jgi:hypothetical protein
MMYLKSLRAIAVLAAICALGGCTTPAGETTQVIKSVAEPTGRAAGPFDGQYHGGAALVFGPNSCGAMGLSASLRQVEVDVTSGNGLGTVRFAQCPDAGEIKLTIDSNGDVTGTADMLTHGTCGSMPGAVEGRAEAGRLLLSVRYDNRISDFSLTRR